MWCDWLWAGRGSCWPRGGQRSADGAWILCWRMGPPRRPGGTGKTLEQEKENLIKLYRYSSLTNDMNEMCTDELAFRGVCQLNQFIARTSLLPALELKGLRKMQLLNLIISCKSPLVYKISPRTACSRFCQNVIVCHVTLN